jgi:chorismate dehydratase
MLGGKKMLKMGKISYTNVLPIYHFFNEDRFKDKVEVIQQIPAQLNHAMRNGQIDLGPISSFAYAENASSYLLMPNLSVSSKGKVGSIFLFSKKPLESLHGASIALTSSSATSVALLKIILEYFYQFQVTYHTMSPSLPDMMKEHDASLLIGDDALLANRENPHPYIYDLGELWYAHTNKYMTFAVWAVRKEAVELYPVLLSEIFEEFVKSKALGETKRSKMIEELCQTFGGETLFWETYFAGLSYNFEEQHKKGLEHFYHLAHRIGILSQPTKVEIWRPTDAVFR